MTEDEMREALTTELDREIQRRGQAPDYAYYEAHELADALLPVVRRIAAEELRAAAARLRERSELARNGENQWGKDTFDHGEAYAFREAAGECRDRADALDPPDAA